MSNMETQLVAQGVNQDVARACSKLFASYEEAARYALPPLPPGDVEELYSLLHRRYYYHCKRRGDTSWDMPPQLQLGEWLLDAAASGLPPRTCRQLQEALLAACSASAHKGEALWGAVALLGRLTSNIVQCGNSLEKYRTVRTCNPRIREALDLLPGGEELLCAAGFVRQPEAGGGSGITLCFPGPGADLRPITLLDAKLQQLSTRKGFTGMARECDDTRATARSRHYGTPGFRYQQEVFECSCCSRPINDGSDRLVTRQADAPQGEFRYECQTCPGFNLCEGCWDKFLAGSLAPAHPRDHPFEARHPKVNLHNLNSAASASNPWGVVLAGGSAARARERLKDRTGL